MDKKKHAAVFLDRDGVINDIVNRGDDFSVKGKKVRLTAPFKIAEFRIKEGVREALEKIKTLGFLLILVSNQPDIKYGLMTEEDNKEIMEEIKKLPLDDIFICYHGRDDNCSCKKPKPGLLLAASDKWNIDFCDSCIIGDTANDMLAGRATGCRTILIDCFYNREVQSDFRVQNLSEAVCLIRNFSAEKEEFNEAIR